MTTQHITDSEFSDLHKDAYGFRPSQESWVEWNAFTEDQKEIRYFELLDVLREENLRQEAAELVAIEKFNAELLQKLEACNWEKTSQEIVLEMVREADPVRRDPNYLTFIKDLPYNHLYEHYGIK